MRLPLHPHRAQSRLKPGELSRERILSLPRWLCIAATLFFAAGFHWFAAGDELPDYDKGLAYRLEGKNRQAVEAFDRALAVDPLNVKALIQKGAALEDRGKWKLAVQAYRQALTIDPNNRIARRNLDQLLSLRLITSPPEGSNPVCEDLINKGLLSLKRGDLSRAAEVFCLAHGLSSNDPRPAFFWALTLEEQGKNPEAGALYRKTVESFPDYVPARINLILSLLGSGQTGEAVQEARKGVTDFPESHEIKALYAFLQRKSSRIHGAQADRPAAGSP